MRGYLRPVLHRWPIDRRRTWNEGLRQPGKTRQDDPQSSTVCRSDAASKTSCTLAMLVLDAERKHDFTAGYGLAILDELFAHF